MTCPITEENRHLLAQAMNLIAGIRGTPKTAKEIKVVDSNIIREFSKPKEKARPEFDKLPAKVEGQRTMTYAGIGSRETPLSMLRTMTKVADMLAKKGYTLNSGGAIGADVAFEGKSYPTSFTAKEDINEETLKMKKGETVDIGNTRFTAAYYLHAKKDPRLQISSVERNSAGTPNTVSFSPFDVTKNKYGNAETAKTVASEIHPKWGGLKDFAKNLMARNTYQIFGKDLATPVDFVLFYALETDDPFRPKGGTGQAVEMARRKGIPTINMSSPNWEEQLENVLSELDKDVGSKEVLYSNDTSSTSSDNSSNSSNTVQGINISSKSNDSLGRKLTNVHYAKNGESEFDITPSNKQLIDPSKVSKDWFNNGQIKSAKSVWGLSVEAWYKANMTHDDEHDVKLMEGLIVDKLKQYPELVQEINERGGVAFLESSTHYVGNGRWSTSGKNLFINTLVQAYKIVKEETLEDSTFTAVEPKKEDGAFPIGNGRYTNKDQTAAVDKIVDWYKNSKAVSYLLTGRGGTGKTATVNAIVRELGKIGKKVMVLAPTHQAVSVIEEANKGTVLEKADHNTIASFLKKQPVYNKDGSINRFERKLGDEVDNESALFVIDEASMISSDDYKDLVDHAKTTNSRIIFMGDEGQLPPVEDLSSKYESPVFRFHNEEVKSTLVEQMRQTKGNKMAELLESVYSTVLSFIEARKNGKSKPTTANEYLWSDSFRGLGNASGTYENGKGLLGTDSSDLFVTAYIDDLIAKGAANVKMINYNNSEHQNTKNTTKYIRTTLLSKGFLQLEEGQTLDSFRYLGKEPIRVDNTTLAMGSKGNIELSKGSELVITNVVAYKDLATMIDQKEAKGEYVRVGLQSSTATSDSQRLHRDDVGRSIKVYKDRNPVNTTLNDLVGEVYEITATYGSEEVTLYTPKDPTVVKPVRSFYSAMSERGDPFAKSGKAKKIDFLIGDISLAYVINAHKAQGSSYDAVYADINNIASVRTDDEIIMKSIYVAISRPKEKLVLLHSGLDSNTLTQHFNENNNNTKECQ